MMNALMRGPRCFLSSTKSNILRDGWPNLNDGEKDKNLENVQIDALDLLVLLYYYLYYCITNCITVLLLVNTCQYSFVLLHLNSFWKIVINVVPASIVYIVNIVNIVIIVTMRYLIFSKMRYERTNWTKGSSHGKKR